MYIYRILNKINGKSYIGSTISLEKRFQQHINSSKWESCVSYNYPLQRAFRKYGIDNFDFLLIEEISQEKVAEREKYWIKYYNTLTNSGWGYNQTIETECALRDPEIHKKQIEESSKKCALVDKNNNILELYESLNDAARKNNRTNAASNIKRVCEGEYNTTFNGKIFRYVDNLNNVIIPEIKTKKHKLPIRGVSISDPNDIVIYESISEAARKENIDRGSLHKHLKGITRYSKVKNRIWNYIKE